MKTKIIFWQDWGTFPGVTMVTCGFKDYEDIKKFLKKKKFLDWLDALEKKSDKFDSKHFSKWKVGDGTYSLLFLTDFKPDLEHYKILAHELVHAISFCMVDYMDPMEEYEAFAYQHSYLMENIVKQIYPKVK